MMFQEAPMLQLQSFLMFLNQFLLPHEKSKEFIGRQ
jgi:hypothetical protein